MKFGKLLRHHGALKVVRCMYIQHTPEPSYLPIKLLIICSECRELFNMDEEQKKIERDSGFSNVFVCIFFLFCFFCKTSILWFRVPATYFIK